MIQAPVKFNQRIIDEVVIPALDMLDAAYTTKDPSMIPVPDLAIYSDARAQWQKNWLCTYCEFHKRCVGAGWELEASNLVTTKNKEHKAALSGFAHTLKKEKPTITVAPSV